MMQISFKTLLITSPILITFLLSMPIHATQIVITTTNSPYYDLPTDASLTISIDLGIPPAPRPNGLSYNTRGCSYGRGGARRGMEYGPPPNTLAEYYAQQQYSNLDDDLFDVSHLVNSQLGFNVRAHGAQPRLRRVHQRRVGPVTGPTQGQWRVRRPVHRVQDGRVVMQLREIM